MSRTCATTASFVGLCALGALALFPVRAFAALMITEVMYDVPGGDSGREWIEVTNEGAVAADVSTYAFFENNTNHSLSVLSGSGVLAPQASAVIAQDEAKFRADFPSFSGSLLHASFSLSNTGETLALKDDAGNIDDTVSYGSSLGAAEDGNSLHRSGDSFIAGAPTPGVFSEHEGTGSGGQDGAAASPPAPQRSSEASSATAAAGGPPGPPMEVDLGGDRVVEVGAGSFYEGQVYNGDGVPLQNATYFWNFGDGATRTGKSVFYAYAYPGTYAVVLTVDAGNGYSVSARATATAVPAELSLREESDGSLTVSNDTHAGHDLDLSLWMLSRGGTQFTIPKGTFVLAGKAVRFSPSVLNLPAGEAALLYPSGVTAATDEKAAAGITYLPAPRSPAPTPATGKSSSSSADAPNASSTRIAAAAVSGVFVPLSYSLAGLAALTVLGIAGALYARPRTSAGESAHSETDRLAEEFDIIEG